MIAADAIMASRLVSILAKPSAAPRTALMAMIRIGLSSELAVL
jgi:hypothetical protein